MMMMMMTDSRHNMSTLHYRRVRGDMIETYKILSGKYDTNVVSHLKTTGIQATQGNDLRNFKTLFKYDWRKFCFTNRVVEAWNSLPNWIVVANSTNTFKHRLDIQWQRQKFLPAGVLWGTTISNGAHLTVAQRPRKACKPGPFFKLVFPVSEFATNSTCLLCGML